jgi:hypothetical protein
LSKVQIRDWCRSKPALRQPLLDKLWHLYRASSKRHFAQRLRRLLEWGNQRTLPKAIDGRLQRLKDKSSFFQRAFDFPTAYRTSNEVDRPMNYLDRILVCHASVSRHMGLRRAIQSGHGAPVELSSILSQDSESNGVSLSL